MPKPFPLKKVLGWQLLTSYKLFYQENILWTPEKYKLSNIRN